MDDTNTKSWYTSKGVVGSGTAIIASVVSIVVVILRQKGIEIDDATQSEIVTLVSSLVAVIGGAVALVGRLKAKKEIGK